MTLSTVTQAMTLIYSDDSCVHCESTSAPDTNFIWHTTRIDHQQTPLPPPRRPTTYFIESVDRRKITDFVKETNALLIYGDVQFYLPSFQRLVYPFSPPRRFSQGSKLQDRENDVLQWLKNASRK